MKGRTKAKLIALVLMLQLALVLYLALVARFGYERTEALHVQLLQIERDGMKLSEIPAAWVNELLAVEDPAFYQHNGIDLLTAGAGVTTITQGLVKTHFFESFKPGLAKFRQSVLALVLDSRMSKESQLLLFFNTANLGHLNRRKVSGFRKASEAYFAKPFEQISHDEFLSLVAMLIGPNRYNVVRNPSYNAERVARIKLLLAGACMATGVTDVYYSECIPEPASPGR